MAQSVFSTLIQVILPISVPILAGVMLAYFKGQESKPLLNMTLYFLAPCMIFTNLFSARISASELTGSLLFSLLNLTLLWAISRVVGRLLKLTDSDTAGLTLVSTFTNSVNYGLPLVLMAFGRLGLEKAAVYVVIQIMVTNTAGVYFAARSNFSITQSMKSIFKLPAIYAAMLAALLRFLELHLPDGIETGVSMVAGAYSPVMLFILGTQLMNVKKAELDHNHRSAFWAGIGIRMLVSPLLALLVLNILGIEGILFPVLLILASMPVAVNSVLLAEKFDAAPKLVSKCILWTTLASFIVLPVLITLVKG